MLDMTVHSRVPFTVQLAHPQLHVIVSTTNTRQVAAAENLADASTQTRHSSCITTVSSPPAGEGLSQPVAVLSLLALPYVLPSPLSLTAPSPCRSSGENLYACSAPFLIIHILPAPSASHGPMV